MVFAMQQLAIQHTQAQRTRSKTTLTDLHDTNASWTGLGGAFLSLWWQTRFRRNTVRAVFAVAYLSVIAALHATIPALLSVQVVTENQPIDVMTRGLMNLTEAASVYVHSHLMWRLLHDR